MGERYLCFEGKSALFGIFPVTFMIFCAAASVSRAFRVDKIFIQSSASQLRSFSIASKSPVFWSRGLLHRHDTSRMYPPDRIRRRMYLEGSLVEKSVWWSYEQCITELMFRERVVGKLRPREMGAVQDYLLLNRPLVETYSVDGLPETAKVNALFRQVTTEQKENFCNISGFSEGQYAYLTRCICYVADFCAKEQSAEPALVAWHKLKEVGFVPRENTISTYMYVLSLSPEAQEACWEVASFHDFMFKPNEKTITIRIKSLVARGDAPAAERLLGSLPCKGDRSEWKRLRTFTPILSYYCETGRMGAALRLFRQMKRSDGVFFDAETYGQLVASLARRGWFRVDAHSIDSIVDCGFSVGPALFDEVSTEMADDLLELSEAAVSEIASGFADGHVRRSDPKVTINNARQMNCGDVEKARSNDNLIGRVVVNSTTALCPQTGATLRLMELTELQRLKVHDTLLKMAAAQHEDFGAKLRCAGKSDEARDGQFAINELSKFSSWLHDRDFSAVIDGPNVAFFGHGSFHYSQIKLVVDKLLSFGENPLVIMPEKYAMPKFWLAGLGLTQDLTVSELEIMQSLVDNGKMYIVPSGCLDDYYWMLASVANQNGEVSSVRKSQLPGLRPLLVTNDQMRDHRLSLLEPRLFRRWMSCHVVNYDIRSYVNDEGDSRQVQFYPADVFSREIQGNQAKNHTGLAWHFPVSEWPEFDRFCVAIRR
jgi:pentatricopeptide repeat protein